MREKDLEDALIGLGKKKGVLTFDEMNAAFPGEYCTLAEIEGFLRRLDHIGVKVDEGRKQSRGRSRRKRAA